MYAELHAKTNFSFLEGASHPDELVHQAAELGYRALAVTDRNSLAGVVRAHGAAKDAGLKLIVGAEITPDDAPPVVLWATDRASYGRLARLITEGRRRAEKGECRLSFEDIAKHAEGLLAGVRGERREERGEGNDEHIGWHVPERSEGRDCRPATPFAAQGVPPHPTCDIQPSAFGIPSTPPSPLSSLLSYRNVFGDRCYLLAELHLGPDDRQKLARLKELSRQTRIPLVAAGDVHYHAPHRAALHNVLTAVRYGCTVADVAQHLFANAERHLRPLEEIAALFADAPDAVRRTVEIADRSTFSLDELRYEYPEELAPPGQTASEYLARLAWDGARQRYPSGVPQKVRNLLEHELQLISELHYEAYFLTVWDLVRFARQRGILCQGRGSAANSAVCYCLGVTAVDPERMDVLFERFVSRERNEAPDIDVDFEHQRREEVLQYLYQKYGRDRAGMTAEVITYRTRSAVRDVGKALGLPPERIDALAERLEHFHQQPDLPQRRREADIDPETFEGRQLVELVEQLVGFPRHLSQHTGGMVMTRGPLCELVPIENAAMPDRTVIEWNKDDLDELGILKVDCLALGMLSAIRLAFDLVERHYGQELTLANIPAEDPGVYEMIRHADTMGVFQIESRAQMSMLPRLKPRSFYDLVIEVAIVRPGPIQGDMVHPYLRRRSGEETVTYPNERIRGVLEKTLGVPLFQEQAMRLAVVAAGFTPGEADELRRAMGAWRRPGVIEQFRTKLIQGMQAHGFPPEYAELVFGQIRGFGDYGFPESHAASFALLVYVSAWLKHHYPAAFTAALLNSQPMGFYAPAQLVRNAREHGVEVLPVDVNYSDWECTLEERGERREERGEESYGWHVPERSEGRGCRPATPVATPFAALRDVPPAVTQGVPPHPTCDIEPSAFGIPSPSLSPLSSLPFSLRLGFNVLLGMPAKQTEQIVETRRAGPFRSLEDFARRTGLSRAAIARLAKAAAFDSLKLTRRTALWEAMGQDQKELPLFDRRVRETHRPSTTGSTSASKTTLAKPVAPAGASGTHPTVPLPPMSPSEEVLADYRTAGLSLRAHPLQFLRADLNRLGIVTAEALQVLPNGKLIRVAGIVLVRQRPSTAKGITFVTLEDETGTANLIVRPRVWNRYREAAMTAKVMLAYGNLQRQGEVIHLLTTKLEDLSPWMRELGSQARDFC